MRLSDIQGLMLERVRQCLLVPQAVALLEHYDTTYWPDPRDLGAGHVEWVFSDFVAKISCVRSGKPGVFFSVTRILRNPDRAPPPAMLNLLATPDEIESGVARFVEVISEEGR